MSFRGRFLVRIAALAIVVSFPAGLRADEKYEVLKEKFNVTLEKSRAKGEGRFRPVGNESIAPVDQTQVIKVWAALVGPGQTEGSGTLINAEEHTWAPKDRFYLWFECASPTSVALSQLFDPSTGKKSPQPVLPHPDFPKSYKPIAAGKQHKFDVLIELDDDLNPEQMLITTWLEGSPNPLQPALFAGNKPNVGQDARPDKPSNDPSPAQPPKLPEEVKKNSSDKKTSSDKPDPDGQPKVNSPNVVPNDPPGSVKPDDKKVVPQRPTTPSVAQPVTPPVLAGQLDDIDIGTTTLRVNGEVREVTESDPILREKMRFRVSSPPKSRGKMSRFKDDVASIGTADTPKAMMTIVFKKTPSPK